AEDGIRDFHVTGVQTCALPIWRCGRPLAYDGRGRPPEYCPDRRWADGKTCKQMAAAERAAERAAGLEMPLETFRAAGERLVSVEIGRASCRERVQAVGVAECCR